MTYAYLAGLRLGLGLILVIGAQNAFVLRQGLRREHVLAVASFCAASDAALIALGIGGFATLAEAAPWLAPLLRWGGVAFLGLYGLRAFRAALAGGAALEAEATAGAGSARRTGTAPLGPVLVTLVALTWANPHVWLDTVVLLGSVSAQFPGREAAFGLGAATGSFLFFFALAYGARLLAPLFARPGAWRLLDLFVAAVMWSVALGLALG